MVRGIHYLTFGSTKQSTPTMAAQERFIQLKKLLPNWVFFSDASKYSFDVWQKTYTHIVSFRFVCTQSLSSKGSRFQYSALSLSLPQNVNLMTLEPWKENSILVRFEHILERNDDPEYSKPAMFNLKDVFHNFDISDIRETTLSANQWKTDATRMKFRLDGGESSDSDNSILETGSDELNKITVLMKDELNDEGNVPRYIRYRSRGVDTAGKDTWNVILQPMEIRTFIMTLEWRP